MREVLGFKEERLEGIKEIYCYLLGSFK